MLFIVSFAILSVFDQLLCFLDQLEPNVCGYFSALGANCLRLIGGDVVVREVLDTLTKLGLVDDRQILVSEYGRDYEAIENADHNDLADAIRTADLANQKATRIQDALQTVSEHEGDYPMDFIRDMAVDKALEWLTDVHGICKKTA